MLLATEGFSPLFGGGWMELKFSHPSSLLWSFVLEGCWQSLLRVRTFRRNSPEMLTKIINEELGQLVNWCMRENLRVITSKIVIDHSFTKKMA